MLEEQDIQKLAQVFATKAELEAAVSKLMAMNNEILNAIDAYANKADTYFQEYEIDVRAWLQPCRKTAQ